MSDETGPTDVFDVLSHIAFALVPGGGTDLDVEDLPDIARALVAENARLRDDLARERWVRLAGDTERDRLRAVVDAAGRAASLVDLMEAVREAPDAVAQRYVEVRAERDRLRAVVDAQAASLARLKEFAESEILARVSAELGADLRAQLNVSPDMGEPVEGDE